MNAVKYQITLNYIYLKVRIFWILYNKEYSVYNVTEHSFYLWI